mmetsp:Transcript_22528/g.49249  ORF Transcript_22528/g.49249 Transcript_22528/m.49249 type:complete len:607 (+) Transcript_22528:172-1992(+)|eukprot:CAMPEP_0202920150 /NCGR_PEP_ID=MMETSP1392-20130828/76706_1 /ASSEMBLY_ACC=CAM_ASM_000868 /TAXON_ID=225041 /ORGANISM="Chlamydomonas chlamydogama, Strain SAG 11-48b" /LENGTH=606 /DNA_ID=CAMNT_0049613633 /DNA_START=106 /DNA_END=1926 /DNA_ORIENTATION=-
MKPQLGLALLFLVSAATASDIKTLAKEKGYFLETFDAGWDTNWVHSARSKYQGKFQVVPTEGYADLELKVPAKNQHYGLTVSLPKPVDPSEGLVVQYETKYASGYTCGGSYIKLLTYDESFSPDQLEDNSPYTIMFGPDKCGDPQGKIHLILRHKNPLNGTFSEKHLASPPTPLQDSLPHTYTLIITPDNHYKILVDGESKSSGSLLEALNPPINPPEEIPDPEDTKPKDWVDDAKIPDPTATKPADWDDRKMVPDEAAKKPSGWLDDEPLTVPDKSAKRPAEWSDEEDGVWTAPTIPNPKCKKAGCGEWKRPLKKNPDYKGEWEPPLIDNPAYKGPWVQKQIKNPDHYVDPEPLTNIGLIGAVAIEIWTVDEGYVFDNFFVAEGAASADVATKIREQLWRPKFNVLKAAADAKQAEEAAKAKAQEEEVKKRREAAGKSLPHTLLKLFDSGSLKPLKPYLVPLLDQIRKTPNLAYVLVAGPPLVLLIGLVVMIQLGRGRSSSSSRRGRRYDPARAKKEDISGEDDQQEEEEQPAAEAEAEAEAAGEKSEKVEKSEKEEGKDVKVNGKAPQAAAAAKEEAKDEEIEADDGDEASGGAGVRRRTRRDA